MGMPVFRWETKEVEGKLSGSTSAYCLRCGCCGETHYLYPLRNVFKTLLLLAGTLPGIISLCEGSHAFKKIINEQLLVKSRRT